MKSIRKILFLVLTLICLAHFTYGNPCRDLACFNLNGKVKSVTGQKQGVEYRLIFNEEGLLVQEINYTCIGIIEFLYNSKGLLIKEIRTADSLIFRTEYEYNQSGKLLKSYHYTSDNTIGMVWFYLYSQDGQLNEKKGFEKDSILIEHYKYVYNSTGNLYEEYMCNSDSSKRLLVRNSYDSFGRCVKSTKYKSNQLIESELEYVFNDDGVKVQQHFCSIDLNGNLHKVYMNKYSGNGELSETTDYFQDGKIKLIQKVNYLYDENSNYITSSWFENDNLIGTFTRQIEYFQFKILMLKRNLTGKGYRIDGRRHPHSWSILDSEDTANWIEKMIENEYTTGGNNVYK